MGDSIVLRKFMSLVEFIDSVRPIGSVKVFLEERDREEGIEAERAKECVRQYSRRCKPITYLNLSHLFHT